MGKSITGTVKLVIILISGLFIVVSCNSGNKNKRVVFTVQYEPGYIKDIDTIFLSIGDISQRYGIGNMNSYVIKDLDDDKIYSGFLVDTNADEKPDIYAFVPRKRIDEPLRPFEILKGQDENAHISETVRKNAHVKITYLVTARDYQEQNAVIKDWPDTIAQSVMRTYPDPSNLEIFSKGQWSYTNGFFNNALCVLYNNTHDSLYEQYVEKWLSNFISDKGTLDTNKYESKKQELDDILPGRSLLYMFGYTHDSIYHIAADELINELKNQPRTSEGGFWHKKVYPWQMWLDGIYMGDVYMLQYASQFEKPEIADDAIHQIKLIYKKTLDPKTGLLYHGWDESKNKIWADSITGTSSEFWGRGIGWYAMALTDALDYIPEGNPDRDSLIIMLQDLSRSLARYQDPETGLWFQVVDKGNVKGNWIETSCSAMFAYAFAKGSKKGYLDPGYLSKARKAFQGLENNYLFFDDEGKVYLTGTVKVGTLNFKYSDGSYNYYISVDRRVNDFKGISALLYLSMALNY